MSEAKQNRNETIWYLCLILGLICLASGLLLGIAYESLKGTIDEKKEAVTQEAFKSVLTVSYDHLEKIDLGDDEDDVIKQFYKAVDSRGNTVSYCMQLSAKGYKGDEILFALGINTSIEEAVISGISIISNSETPGLGAECNKTSFTRQFKGKTLSGVLKSVKQPTGLDNDIDVITGATRTTNGIVEAINSAAFFYNNYSPEGELPE